MGVKIIFMTTFFDLFIAINASYSLIFEPLNSTILIKGAGKIWKK
jgi:hypothetical protein